MRLWGLAGSVTVGVQRDILSPVSLAKCLLPGGVTSGVGKAGGRSWAGGWTALILFKQRWLLRTSSFWQGSEWEARGRLCWCLMGWLSYCWCSQQLLRLVALALLRVPGYPVLPTQLLRNLCRGRLCFGL